MNKNRLILLICLLLIGFVINTYGQEYALQFDGQNDYVNCGSNSSLDITASNSTGLTVEMWIKRTEVNVEGGLFGRFVYDIGGYEVWIDQNNYLLFQIAAPSFTRINAWGFYITSGTWHHIACTVSNTGIGRIYVDGIDRTSNGYETFSMPASVDTNATIGSAPNGLEAGVIIDEVRVSNIVRYTTNFTVSTTPFTVDGYTKGLWHFNEGGGLTVNDVSGNNNNGTLVNGPIWTSGYFSGTSGDTIPPNPVTDLKAIPGSITGSVFFTWTSPGDDGLLGALNGTYRIQYSTYVIQWNRANAQISISTSNVNPGSKQAYLKTGLSPGVTYYFRMWVGDDALNWSGISNGATSYAKTGANNPPYAPTNLLCNGMNNPTLLTDFTPDLSWTFNDPDNGDTQSAYRLLVANSITNIDNNIGNMWDTNKVNSSVNKITYSGNSLSYSGVYYWKVMTWDTSNSSSPYSTTATFSMRSTPPPTTSYFAHPYGVNAWAWTLTGCQQFRNAHIDHYRVMVSWPDNEPSDNNYTWDSAIDMALDSANSLSAKVSLCVYLSFNYSSTYFWARTKQNERLSVNPSKYAEFITALLQHCKSRGRINVVESVEIMNEEPTGEGWDSTPITKNTDQRDPSLYYANILKAAYNAIKSFNSANGTDILCVMDGMWYGAYHHLDELYQLGCKGYFDRINFHYYVQDFGAPEDPSYTGSTWHFPTTLRYIKYLAEDNGDYGNIIWLSEFGWRISDEVKKKNYMNYVLDISRKSGFVEHASMYVGLAGGYPRDHDIIGLIYTDRDYAPSYFVYTESYYMYQNYGSQYQSWDPNTPEPIPLLTPASDHIKVANPGFETGDSVGWDEVGTIDSTIKHTGQYSCKQVAPKSIRTKFYPVEPNRLYEIICWIKVDATNTDACMISPRISQMYNNTNLSFYEPPNYYGIVDTRNYPNGWRRIRFMYLVPTNVNQAAVEFLSDGTGTYWIDDLLIKSLNFSTEIVEVPVLYVNNTNLEFGDVLLNEEKTDTFIIKNIGKGTLIGTITADEPWISVNPVNFAANNINIDVTIKHSDVDQMEGNYTGKINIKSNGGNASVEVSITATCVLPKPNPYNPNKGLLTFFGSGIVPDHTTIKIYTLSGELVKELANSDSIKNTKEHEIVWDGKNSLGELVTSGVYLYVYESPREKGIGKFTLIRK